MQCARMACALSRCRVVSCRFRASTRPMRDEWVVSPPGRLEAAVPRRGGGEGCERAAGSKPFLPIGGVSYLLIATQPTTSGQKKITNGPSNVQEKLP